MDGVNYKKSQLISFIIIERFSSELEGLLRSSLTGICHGRDQLYRESGVYSYRRTLIEFLKRFDTKTPETKMGMVGELLSHLLILHFESSLVSINPFFNMEERNIKKGFDLVLLNPNQVTIFYTEIKSGSPNNQSSSEKSTDLLKLAYSDIKTKLSEDRDSLWLNAMAGTNLALSRSSNLKEVAIELLENDTRVPIQSSVAKSALITAVLFEDIKNPIEQENLESLAEDLASRGEFKNLICFTIHKSTVDKAIEFLRNESLGPNV